MWHGSELLFAFYLTEVCRMAPALMGLVLALALLASGAMDIVVGRLLRKRTRSVRAAAAVQLVGACGAGVAFFLFLGIELLVGGRHVLLALTIGLAFRLAYAFYDVPQNAVLGLARGGSRLRAGLSSLRFVCSGLAALTIAALAALLLMEGRHSAWFAALGAAVGVVAVVTSFLFWRMARMHAAGPGGTDQDPETMAPCTSAARASPRRRLAMLLGLGFIVSASSAVFMKLEPYFAAYLLHSTLSRGTLMVTAACGGIASQAFTFWSMARWSRAAAFRSCAVTALAGALGFLALGVHGAAWASAAGFLVGFGLNGLAMLLWSGIADLAAARAHTSLAPTVVFSLLTFSQKAASALGTLAIGAMLGSQAAAAGAAPGSTSTLVLAMSAIPLAGALACLALAGVFAARRRPAPGVAQAHAG